MQSNRSPSPLSSRNCKNPAMNTTTRCSFNGRPNTNPKTSYPPIPAANTPTATTDPTKRNSIVRKSTGSLFQDGKENHKDALRSPAKTGSKNFMSPTISAASKFTPSPRKRILGEKNDVTRTSIQFLDKDKDSDFRSEAATFDQTIKMNDDLKGVEQKETVSEVTLSSTDESFEMLSGCTEETDVVSIRAFCSSPITSPAVDCEPRVPPYDPKDNFCSPRPRFLHYKPNPRIEKFLNKDGSDDSGEDDVGRLEGSFIMSESSDTEVEEQEQECESGDSVHGSLEFVSEKVLEEEKLDSKVGRKSKGWFFTGSKTIWFTFLMFLVLGCSVSLTDYSPLIKLPVYKDVGFSEIYHESLKFVEFAKEHFDVLAEDLKNWSIDFVSYISHQKSQLFPSDKDMPIVFFNLTTSVQEEFMFNRHIGTDYIQEIKVSEEEMRDETEMIEEEEEDDDFAEMEVDDDIDVTDEAVNDQPNDIQSYDDDAGFVESKSEPIYKAQSESVVNDLEIASDVADSEPIYKAQSETAMNDLDKICLAGFPIVILAGCAIFYTLSKRKSNVKKPATIRVADDVTCKEESSCSSSVGNEHKKKTSNNKRESVAISSSDFSMGCSYGSFTTFERIPIKKKDEVILTPIRRSSRLLKNQVS
ncbi:hypothetical protein QVD17_26695 [Tagetes erecta]|uniref:Uncharacterized protein n=1 Tax=Tagetes erecta TaxID=13708 RepID=A0AAD8KAJ8_TARER|nr:hypothetical protein QVD17_26695 [Tagetes erecta]